MLHKNKYKMKKICFIILMLFASLGSMQAQILTFEWQGSQRQYLVKIPAQCDNAVPILYFLHGLGDNITRVDNEFHFQQVADQFGWIIVVPQALSQSGATMWNAAMTNSNIDDSGFLMALLDTLATQYPVDMDSVFFTGFSMGGFMTHRMAIEHGDRITGCAPVSGLITHAMSSHTAAAPVKMLHIHGTSDPVVGYDGSSQYFGGNLGLNVDAILNYWQNANHCTGTPLIDTFPDLKNDGLLFVRFRYEGDAELEHVKVIGGNHTWYLNENQTDIAYFNEIHRFFTQGNGSNVGIAEPVHPNFRFWPNPTRGLCSVEAETDSSVELIDLQGRTMARYLLKKGVNEVDLSRFPAGTYLFRTSTDIVGKVIVKQ